MAVFKAGQRVKIVRGRRPEDVPSPSRIAKTDGCYEGVLVEPINQVDDFFGSLFGSSLGDWIMCLDNGVTGAVHEYMLEPIQPERNQIVAWESVPGGKPCLEEIAA